MQGQLDNFISPIEETSTSVEIEQEPEALFDSDEFLEEEDESEVNLETEINPFTSFSEESTISVTENNSELELADRLLGSFDESELQSSDDVIINDRKCN